MAVVQITPQEEIPAGARNQAQAHNDNIARANANDEALATELGRQAGQPTVRSLNGRSPDASGALVLPITSNSEPMSEAQKLALPAAGLTIGRKIYNTTTGQEEVYGNRGWQESGSSPAPRTDLGYVGGVLTTLTERTDAGTLLSTTTLRYTGGVLTSVVEEAGVTTTVTLNYAGGVLTSVVYD